MVEVHLSFYIACAVSTLDQAAVAVVKVSCMQRSTNHIASITTPSSLFCPGITFSATLRAGAEDLQPHLLHALGTSFKDVTSLVTAEKAFGVVPSDEEDISVPSVLANLYLPPLHILLAVRWVCAIRPSLMVSKKLQSKS